MTPEYILILEDEQQAGEKLQRYVQRAFPQATIHWERSVRAARKILRTPTAPDLIVSDIELLDGSVFALFAENPAPCPIIFCSAYDQYLLNALQTNGIGFVLKPYSWDDFSAAIDQFHRLFPADLARKIEYERRGIKTKIEARQKGKTYLLDLQTVRLFRARGDFVVAWDRTGQQYVINDSLKHLETILNPEQFFRINRSEIIAFSTIAHFTPHTKNRLAITLIDTEETVYTSNSRTPAFRAWLAAR